MVHCLEAIGLLLIIIVLRFVYAMRHELSRKRKALLSAALIGVFLQVGLAQAQTAKEHGDSPLTLNQAQYRLRAGESTRVDATSDTLDFLLHAKTRRIEIAGTEARGIVVGPNRAGDQILLAASLTMKPGKYAVTVSGVNGAGKERGAVVDVTLDPMQPVPSNATVPPVVLLNGWQFGYSSTSGLSTCPVSSGSSDTFGSLENRLATSQSVEVYSVTNGAVINGAGVPVVYFFDNCVEDPNGPIETLGDVLGDVVNLIRYDNGTLVPQVDLVSHSMGGLIVRAYLSGLQTTGAISPPANTRVRKFIEIATPNFGSFLAANNSFLLVGGTQAPEMFPGSAFLWNLATWNQHGDDLRGVDALAIVGDAGYWQASDLFASESPNLSDGVVSITSASLGFASLTYAHSPSRTRLLPYCHIDSATPIAGALIDCSGGGIADVDEAPDTGAIVLSFLENNSSWQSIGTSNQTEYGGIYLALENAAGTQYTGLEGVSLGSASFQAGAINAFFYDEFVSVPGTLSATSTAGQVTNCGSFSVPGGYYTAVRCKFSPSISSVQSSLSTGLAGLTVASGSTITIGGVGFSSSTGTAVTANGVALTGQIVSDREISALLPSNYSGLVTVAVSNSAGQDSINIVVAPAALPPTISVSPGQLRFSYTVGGVSPAAESIAVANSGGSTLSWSGTTSASWLSITPASGTAPSTLSVLISPMGLGAGTYTGSVQISAAGASNSPVSVTITLTVAPAPASLAVSPQALTFRYTVGSSIPVSEGASITNKGGGTLSWTASATAAWIVLSPVSGTAPATVSVSVNPATLAAGTYAAKVQITATGASGSPASVGVTLVVQAPAPVLTVALSTAGQVEPLAAQSIVTAYGTNLATGTATASLPLPTLLGGTTVTVTDSAAVAHLAPLFYVSPTQVDFEIPVGVATGPATVSIQNQNETTQTATVQIANVSPGLFQLNSPLGLVAAWVLPVISGTQQPLQPVYQIASGSVIPLPINLGQSTQQVYLEMYGTGIHNANSVTATVGGLSVPVLFVGAAPGYAGEDQVNIGPLPQSLAGKGSVNILLTADGQAANTVNVTIQ